jgi:hypothetical protein
LKLKKLFKLWMLKKKTVPTANKIQYLY